MATPEFGRGNPARATDVLELVFYRTAFETGDPGAIGVASALAVCMFAFAFGVSLLASAPPAPPWRCCCGGMPPWRWGRWR